MNTQQVVVTVVLLCRYALGEWFDAHPECEVHNADGACCVPWATPCMLWGARSRLGTVSLPP